MKSAWTIAILIGFLMTQVASGQTVNFSKSFRQFADRFVTSEGRVIDDYNGGVSHSESQGYGMIAAVLAGDQKTFDRIWFWSRENLLIRADHLAAWRWVPNATPHTADLNNATDGDLLIAWALIEAFRRWGRAEDRNVALTIAGDIARLTVIETSFGPVLLPAVSHFSRAEHADGPIINLSYWIFPALQRLAEEDPSGPWSALTRTGLRLVRAARFGPSRLPSDWISLGSALAPAAMKRPEFGYDAVRVPLYLAWANLDDQKDLLQPFVANVIDGTMQVIDLSTGLSVRPFGGDGFRSLAAVLTCRSQTLSPVDISRDVYYPAVINLFSIYVDTLRCHRD